MSYASIPFTLTAAGKNAAFDLGAVNLVVTHVQIGSGNKTPNGNEAALLIPKEYAALNFAFELNAGQHRLAAVIEGSALSYQVSEIGLWSGAPGSPGAVLVFYWSIGSSYIATKNVNINFNFEHDMVFGGVVPTNITFAADSQNAAAMVAQHNVDPDAHADLIQDSLAVVLKSLCDTNRLILVNNYF